MVSIFSEKPANHEQLIWRDLGHRYIMYQYTDDMTVNRLPSVYKSTYGHLSVDTTSL